MSHGPASDWGEDRAAARKSRVGLRMFLAYALVYAGFVVVNTLSPATMEAPVFGVSLSIVYGIGLIVLALVLALIYNHISGRAEEDAR